MKFALVLAFFAVCAVSTIQGASVENNDAAPVVPEPAPVAEEKKQGGFQFFNPFAAVINTVKNVMGMGNNEQGGEMQENIKRVQEIISKIQVLADSDPEAAKVVNKLRANPLSFFENIDECMALLRQVVPKPENTSETAEGEEDIKPIEEVIEANNEDGKKKGFNPIQAALNLFKNIDERRKRLGRFWNEFRRDPLSIVHNFDAIKGDFVFVKGLLQNGLKAGKILNDFRCNPLSMMQNYDEAVELVTGEKPVKKEPETEVVADETAVAVPEKKKSEVETVADRGFRALSIVMEIRCNPLKLFDNIDKLAALADEVTPVGEDGQKQNNPLSFVLNLVKGLGERKDQAFKLFDKIRKNPLSALEHIDDIVKVLTG